jgi:hypothetical protein
MKIEVLLNKLDYIAPSTIPKFIEEAQIWFNEGGNIVYSSKFKCVNFIQIFRWAVDMGFSAISQSTIDTHTFIEYVGCVLYIGEKISKILNVSDSWEPFSSTVIERCSKIEEVDVESIKKYTTLKQRYCGKISELKSSSSKVVSNKTPHSKVPHFSSSQLELIEADIEADLYKLDSDEEGGEGGEGGRIRLYSNVTRTTVGKKSGPAKKTQNTERKVVPPRDVHSFDAKLSRFKLDSVEDEDENSSIISSVSSTSSSQSHTSSIISEQLIDERSRKFPASKILGKLDMSKYNAHEKSTLPKKPHETKQLGKLPSSSLQAPLDSEWGFLDNPNIEELEKKPEKKSSKTPDRSTPPQPQPPQQRSQPRQPITELPKYIDTKSKLLDIHALIHNSASLLPREFREFISTALWDNTKFEFEERKFLKLSDLYSDVIESLCLRQSALLGNIVNAKRGLEDFVSSHTKPGRVFVENPRSIALRKECDRFKWEEKLIQNIRSKLEENHAAMLSVDE